MHQRCNHGRKDFLSDRRRRPPLPVLAALLLGAVTAGCAETTARPAGQPADDGTLPPLVEDPSPEGGLEVALISTADGDTLTVRLRGTEERIRLLGINTPERDECLGAEAGDRLDALVGGAELRLEAHGRDEFDRVLGYLWADGDLVNLVLVAEGLAVTPATGGHRLEAVLTDAEADARQAAVGLWAADACGPATGAAVRIVDLVPDAPGADDENPNGEWVEIRNDGHEPVDLGGWRLRDESTRHRFTFPAGTVLEPGASLLVRSGCGDDGSDVLYWCDGDPVWNNDGDTARLEDPAGNLVDQWSYER